MLNECHVRLFIDSKIQCEIKLKKKKKKKKKRIKTIPLLTKSLKKVWGRGMFPVT